MASSNMSLRRIWTTELPLALGTRKSFLMLRGAYLRERKKRMGILQPQPSTYDGICLMPRMNPTYMSCAKFVTFELLLAVGIIAQPTPRIQLDGVCFRGSRFIHIGRWRRFWKLMGQELDGYRPNTTLSQDRPRSHGCGRHLHGYVRHIQLWGVASWRGSSRRLQDKMQLLKPSRRQMGRRARLWEDASRRRQGARARKGGLWHRCDPIHRRVQIRRSCYIRHGSIFRCLWPRSIRH